MIVNSNLEAAWNYHNATKHSYASVHNNLHFLDWHNQPLPFKAYTTLDPPQACSLHGLHVLGKKGAIDDAR
jgi:hypothetical protein